MNETRYITNLKEARQKAWIEQVEILARCVSTDEHGKAVKRELTAAEEEKLAKTDKAINDYDAQIRHFEEKLEAERAGNEFRQGFEGFVRPVSNGGRVERFGEDPAFRAWVSGEGPRIMELDFGGRIARTVSPSGVVDFRLRNADGTETRDLLKVANASGGYLVPRDFITSVYTSLVQFSAIKQLGVQVIQTPHGQTIDYPKAASFGTAAIVGEGSALAENDPTFTTLSLGAWKYGRLLQISNEMLTDENVNLQDFVAQETAIAMNNAVSAHWMTGTGTNQPTGIFSGAYATVTGQTGATGVPSYSNLIDVEYAVARPYRDNGAQWLFKDSSVASIRKILDTTGRPIWQPSVVAGEPDQLNGHPVVTDTSVSAMGTGIISGAFGDWSRAFVMREAPMKFDMSPDYAFANDLMTYRVTQRVDGKPNDTAAAVYYRGGAS